MIFTEVILFHQNFGKTTQNFLPNFSRTLKTIFFNILRGKISYYYSQLFLNSCNALLQFATKFFENDWFEKLFKSTECFQNFLQKLSKITVKFP